MSSHPFLLPGEEPSAGFDAVDSRVEYVSFYIYVFPFICFHYLNGICCGVKTVILCLQFVNEFSSRIAPLLRMSTIVDMTPWERHIADVYVEEVRELFVEWQAFRGLDVIINFFFVLCCIYLTTRIVSVNLQQCSLHFSLLHLSILVEWYLHTSIDCIIHTYIFYGHFSLTHLFINKYKS